MRRRQGRKRECFPRRDSRHTKRARVWPAENVKRAVWLEEKRAGFAARCTLGAATATGAARAELSRIPAASASAPRRREAVALAVRSPLSPDLAPLSSDQPA